MSRPPNVSTLRDTTSTIPLSVDTSAWIARIRSVPPGSSRSSATACAMRSSPRAQIVTLQPSASSALAAAKPSPRVDPVMIATLSFSWRSMNVEIEEFGWQISDWKSDFPQNLQINLQSEI
jgi:hypothetical protein